MMSFGMFRFKVLGHVMLAALLLAPVFEACTPDDLRTELVSGEERSVLLNLSSEPYPSPGPADVHAAGFTKSMFPQSVEDFFSGAVLAFYDADTGVLEMDVELPGDAVSSPVTVSLPVGRKFNAYLLANLWEVNDSDHSMDRMPSFPQKEADVAAMFYRMDGGDLGGGFRREKFSDVERCGIPMSWSLKGFSAAASGKVDVMMQRLFSRLVVRVDHSGIAGTSLEDFVNGSLEIRQVNARLEPFSSSGSRALSREDVILVGDRDASMDNALVREFVYYIPENCQGVLMPGNADPSLKSVDGVETATSGSGISSRLTFVEFKARIGGTSGFSGDAVYRFFVGQDAVSDFSVRRNQSIRVDLGFDPMSVFVARWKVTVDGLSDRRDFFLSGGELSERLPEGRTIVVRKNRPAVFSLNIETGDGVNRVSQSRLVDKDYEPSYLGELAWTSDFWSKSHSGSSEPRRSELSALGIDVSYSGGKFTLSVTDPSRFVPGKTVPVSLTLYPLGRRIEAVIKTAEDIGFTVDGGSLDKDFFISQHRSVSFHGLEGGLIYYAAQQDQCGRSSGGKNVYNRQWKAGKSLSDPFPFCRSTSAGAPVYPYMDTSAYETQKLLPGESLDVYAFYPNNFDRLSGWKHSTGHILVCTDDVLNDGVFSIPVDIRSPEIYIVGGNYKYLAFDGSEYALTSRFYVNGNRRMTGSDVDEELFNAVLCPKVSHDADASPWLECVSVDFFSEKIYLSKTTLGNRKIEDECAPGAKLGAIQISPNPNVADLYNFSVSAGIVFDYPKISAPEDVERSSYMNSDSPSDEIRSVGFCTNNFNDPLRFNFITYGPGLIFRCRSGEVIKPNVEVECVKNGTKYCWCFKASSQTMVSSSGEPVPGDMLVPYGTQGIAFRVTNKWDGRTSVQKVSFNLSHSLLMGEIGIFNPSPAGTVHYVTQRGAKNIADFIGRAEMSTVRWILDFPVDGRWKKYCTTGPDFYIEGTWYQRDRGKPYKTLNFPVRYVSSSASVWTESLARKTFEGTNNLWLNAVELKSPDGSGFVGPTSSDPLITGDENFTMFFSTSKYAFCFWNGETY